MQGVRADIVWLTSAPMLLWRTGKIPPARARQDNLDAQRNPYGMICDDSAMAPA